MRHRTHWERCGRWRRAGWLRGMRRGRGRFRSTTSWILTYCREGNVMAQVASVTTTQLAGLLTATTGLPASVAEIAAGASIPIPEITVSQIVAQNVAADIAEISLVTKYPS